ncbi:hypothetical protein N5I87_15490 [Ralstonia sp. CHL-2022]|uniref:Uncharacterized protein n=1 Tax=Ralstonia mojiangensis TaxID=2953895 RepID=A0AAE3I5S3_9RALS|nr:hypothetical protein [Ralstonia mojiangensis]MCT7317411.1 hypothetical protein [Ralstonia mojiangensis]
MQSLEAHFLATTQRPLFGDSFRDAVDTAEQLARAPMQFSLCETLRALACREPIPSLPTALAEVMRQHNRNCIEQAVSHVACDKGEAEASALRKVLLAAYNHISYDDVLRGDAFPKENRDLLTHGLSLQLASTA